MKKTVLFIVAIFIAIVSYGQYDAKFISVPNANAKLRISLNAGDYVGQADNGKVWMMTGTTSSFGTLNTISTKVGITGAGVAFYGNTDSLGHIYYTLYLKKSDSTLSSGFLTRHLGYATFLKYTDTVSLVATKKNLTTKVAYVDTIYTIETKINNPFYTNDSLIWQKDTTKNVGIGTTTPVAKLDVLGSFKFVTDSGYNLITGNPFGRTIITNGAHFYKSDATSGGYFYNGITELLNGQKSSSMYWVNDTFGILKYNRVVVDNEEVNMYVVGPGYAYDADINKGFGFDYRMLRDTLQYSALQMFQGDSVCVNNEPSSIEMKSDIFKFTVNKHRENSLYLSGKGIYYRNAPGDTVFSVDTSGIQKNNNISKLTDMVTISVGDSILLSSKKWGNGYIQSDSSSYQIYSQFIFSKGFAPQLNITVGKFYNSNTANGLCLINWSGDIWLKNNTPSSRIVKYEIKY